MAPDSVRLLRITLKEIVAPEPLVAADRHWNPLARVLLQYVKERCSSGWGIGTFGTNHPQLITIR